MGREIIGLGARRVTLVTDEPILKLGLTDPLVELLQAAGITVDVFSEIEPDPDIELVPKGVERPQNFKPDAVIAWVAVRRSMAPKPSCCAMPTIVTLRS